MKKFVMTEEVLKEMVSDLLDTLSKTNEKHGVPNIGTPEGFCNALICIITSFFSTAILRLQHAVPDKTLNVQELLLALFKEINERFEQAKVYD
jgi:hypothetical protein